MTYTDLQSREITLGPGDQGKEIYPRRKVMISRAIFDVVDQL